MRSARLALGVLSTCLLFGLPALSAPLETLPGQFPPEEQTSISVYQIASPAVVTISAGRGSGSGTLVTPEGLVLTNYHVVRSARMGRVQVKTSSGNRYTGQVIAVDPDHDLALVRLNGQEQFPTIALADTSGIQVGQKVYAIGSPFGLSGTFTTGILSRISPEGVLQTDAAINPGNSGGPLLNSRGELIGVNTAILSPGQGGNIGIGFATSSLIAQEFIARNQNNTDLIAADPQPTGTRLGISVDAETLIIQAVDPGSLANQLGLRPGDRLVAVNGQRLESIEPLLNYLDTRPDRMVLTVGRNQSVANLYIDF